MFPVGPYTFRPAKKLLHDVAKNRRIRLTDKETAVLKYLYRSETAVNRQILMHEVWGYNSTVTTHTLETHIYRLRQKIEADPANPSLLVTEGGGYRLRPETAPAGCSRWCIPVDSGTGTADTCAIRPSASLTLTLRPRRPILREPRQGGPAMLNPTSPLPLKDPTLFRQANCIDGKWVQADSGRTIVVKNPATGEAIGEVPALGAAETRRAIEAAHRAQAAWRAMLAKDRAAILRKLNDLMLANADDLAVIMTAEQGKPLAESKGEIAYAASFIEWFAEEGKRIYGDTIPQNAKGRRILVLKEPIGVFAAITPWNFPAAMITRKAGPGWAAGCTGVIRPASQTPFSALALAVLAERAGMPAGRVQRHHRAVGRDRRRTDLQPAGAQADLHRIDRGRRQAARAVRADDQEDQHGTGRQRAVHRVRRRRPRCGGGGRDGEQVPQHRPDLRLRQPHPGAGRRVRRVRRQAEGGGGGDEGRQRHGAGREPGAADQRRRGEEGRGAHRRRAEARRLGGDRRQAARLGGTSSSRRSWPTCRTTR